MYSGWSIEWISICFQIRALFHCVLLGTLLTKSLPSHWQHSTNPSQKFPNTARANSNLPCQLLDSGEICNDSDYVDSRYKKKMECLYPFECVGSSASFFVSLRLACLHLQEVDRLVFRHHDEHRCQMVIFLDAFIVVRHCSRCNVSRTPNNHHLVLLNDIHAHFRVMHCLT